MSRNKQCLKLNSQPQLRIIRKTPQIPYHKNLHRCIKLINIEPVNKAPKFGEIIRREEDLNQQKMGVADPCGTTHMIKMNSQTHITCLSALNPNCQRSQTKRTLTLCRNQCGKSSFDLCKRLETRIHLLTKRNGLRSCFFTWKKEFRKK